MFRRVRKMRGDRSCRTDLLLPLPLALPLALLLTLPLPLLPLVRTEPRMADSFETIEGRRMDEHPEVSDSPALDNFPSGDAYPGRNNTRGQVRHNPHVPYPMYYDCYVCKMCSHEDAFDAKDYCDTFDGCFRYESFVPEDVIDREVFVTMGCIDKPVVEFCDARSPVRVGECILCYSHHCNQRYVQHDSHGRIRKGDEEFDEVLRQNEDGGGGVPAFDSLTKPPAAERRVGRGTAVLATFLARLLLVLRACQ